MEKKKIHKWLIVLIVIASICHVVLLFPLPYALSDGGSTGACSLFGLGLIYDVRNCHELRSSGKDIDGVHRAAFCCPGAPPMPKRSRIRPPAPCR